VVIKVIELDYSQAT